MDTRDTTHTEIIILPFIIDVDSIDESSKENEYEDDFFFHGPKINAKTLRYQIDQVRE